MTRLARGRAALAPRAVSIEHEGRPVLGWYLVEGRVGLDAIITVWTASGRKSTQVGGSPPSSLARMLLRELAEESGT